MLCHCFCCCHHPQQLEGVFVFTAPHWIYSLSSSLSDISHYCMVIHALICCHSDAPGLSDEMQRGSVSCVFARWTAWMILFNCTWELLCVIKSRLVPRCYEALPISAESSSPWMHVFFPKKVLSRQISCHNKTWIRYINGSVNSQSKAGAHRPFVNQYGNKQVHISVVTMSIKG